MINTCFMVGIIDRVFISEPKRADKASAAILLRYGDDRNQSGSAVEFVNAALIRIPPFRLPSVRDRLKVGAFVHVIAHIQGVFKHQAGQGVFEVEIVVDRIDFVQGLNSVYSTYRKGRGAPSNGRGMERVGPEHDGGATGVSDAASGEEAETGTRGVPRISEDEGGMANRAADNLLSSLGEPATAAQDAG